MTLTWQIWSFSRSYQWSRIWPPLSFTWGSWGGHSMKIKKKVREVLYVLFFCVCLTECLFEYLSLLFIVVIFNLHLYSFSKYDFWCFYHFDHFYHLYSLFLIVPTGNIVAQYLDEKSNSRQFTKPYLIRSQYKVSKGIMFVCMNGLVWVFYPVRHLFVLIFLFLRSPLPPFSPPFVPPSTRTHTS